VSTLADVTTPVPLGAGRFSLGIPDGWQQGRGAYGGFTLAALVRAMEMVVADPRCVLRTLSAQLPAITELGDAQIVVEVLRRGARVTTVAARLEQGGTVRTLGTGLFGQRRDPGVRWQTEAPPVAPPWDEVPVVVASAIQAPRCAQHFEFRLVGPPPFSRQAEARCLGWIRPRAPGQRCDAAHLVALVDAYWPAAYSVLSRMQPAATVAFTFELVEAIDDDDPSEPLLLRAYAPAASDGYAFETRELWAADGRLIARNHQTYALG
jgi:acyl-CoA thioesterase